jgi:hypothetical protein
MMKKITTLLCGIALAGSLASPSLAGGKSTTGSATTIPSAAYAGAQSKVRMKFVFTVRTELTSSEIAQLVQSLKADLAAAAGVSQDQLDIEINQQ